MVKFYLVISFLLFGESYSVSAQSKKNQISSLQIRIDSLTALLEVTRNQLDKTKEQIEVNIASSSEIETRLKEELNLKGKTLLELTDKNEILSYKLSLLSDSLSKVYKWSIDLRNQIEVVKLERDGLRSALQNKEKESTNSTSSSLIQTITIGEQEWQVENLNVGTFRNGDSIFEARTNEDWDNANEMGIPAWCYYNNDSENGDSFGRLYNWHAVYDSRGLAPVGFHIPSDTEWAILLKHFEGVGDLGKKLKSKDGWEIYGNGSNETLFSAKAGGGRDDNGSFVKLGLMAAWWSVTEYTQHKSWGYYLTNISESAVREGFNKDGEGLSVRCIKD